MRYLLLSILMMTVAIAAQNSTNMQVRMTIVDTCLTSKGMVICQSGYQPQVIHTVETSSTVQGLSVTTINY